MGKNQRKGAIFEWEAAEYATKKTGDEVIPRRAQGTNDKGDLFGLKCRGKRVTAECKNCRQMSLADWIEQAEIERGNDDGEYGIVIHKRKGKGSKHFGENYVTMTYDTFLAICVGGHDLLQ